MTLRRRTFEILEVAGPRDRASQCFDLALTGLILGNVIAVVLESVDSIATAHATAFLWFERISLAVFATEYVLRLWSCTTDPRFARPLLGRLRYAARPLVVIDLVAFLPGLLGGTDVDTRVLRTLRLLRLLRLLKLTRYSRSLQVFGRVLVNRAPELLSTLFVLVLLLTVASSLMYFVEREENAAFTSIPAAMWWGIATLTTVGYGDITPITPLGRLFGAVIAIMGIGMFAVPAGVLGAAFTEEMARERRRREGGEGPP